MITVASAAPVVPLYDAVDALIGLGARFPGSWGAAAAQLEARVAEQGGVQAALHELLETAPNLPLLLAAAGVALVAGTAAALHVRPARRAEPVRR
ncbi:hypothetical protein [Oerskovia flava]|uniref:hypothetical protein n=1 Tax=Oerskovia flava TaxID=2986422 RepID=UPI00223F6852|nr:hypothetical protein [Oerskovia sp. JB1-3-2]